MDTAVADSVDIEFSEPATPDAGAYFEAAAERVSKLLGPSASDPWETSRFKWLRALPSARRGRAGVEMVTQWLSSLGHRVLPAAGSGVDRFVDGASVEVKLSTCWADGTYRFQQIRDDAAVDHLVLLGVSPHAPHLWIVPREVLWSHATAQHASDDAHRWLVLDAAAPPEWLSRFGGDPQRAATVAAALGGAGTGRDQLALF